uniref:Uncharacterized protein n=1 Tax=Glossina pallidipes TaxID=7398 RepID=A0A1B0A4W9_GLOPL
MLQKVQLVWNCTLLVRQFPLIAIILLLLEQLEKMAAYRHMVVHQFALRAIVHIRLFKLQLVLSLSLSLSLIARQSNT